MIYSATSLYALLGGILPALVWLTFWLYEDHKNPEPKGLILRTFLIGMAGVVFAREIQLVVKKIFGLDGDITIGAIPIIVLIIWAAAEEIIKFVAAHIGGLRSNEDNEPIDPMIYMITAALGFAALENTLFIFGWLSDEGITTAAGIIGGNLRFVGASLLHVVSSGIVGVALGLSFYKTKKLRLSYAVLGLIGASAFHVGFNLLISYKPEFAFGAVWTGVVMLLLAFERVKTVALKPE